jgi:hypothetical protein
MDSKTKRKAEFDNTKLEQSCCAHSQKDSMVHNSARHRVRGQIRETQRDTVHMYHEIHPSSPSSCYQPSFSHWQSMDPQVLYIAKKESPTKSP